MSKMKFGPAASLHAGADKTIHNSIPVLVFYEVSLRVECPQQIKSARPGRLWTEVRDGKMSSYIKCFLDVFRLHWSYVGLFLVFLVVFSDSLALSVSIPLFFVPKYPPWGAILGQSNMSKKKLEKASQAVGPTQHNLQAGCSGESITKQ